MVGSVHGNVNFTDPDDNPDGMVLSPAYTWNSSTGNYVPADTLKEKTGYWVAVLGACDVTIDNTVGLAKASKITQAQQDLFFKQYGSTPPKPPVINWETGEIVQIPSKFVLYQNYPNPFNPATTIRFDLPKESHVEIAIYNVMGQKVATLTDKDFSAGSHQVLWDGKNDMGQAVSSGIYLCRIKAGEFKGLRKLVLVR